MNPRTVLVVDDEPHMLRLIVFSLKSLDARIVTATSGDEALKILREQPVCLAVLDVHMKGIDGIAALREMRADPALASLPVVLLTGAGETHVENIGRELGVSAFFRKPFSPSQLLANIQKLLPPA